MWGVFALDCSFLRACEGEGEGYSDTAWQQARKAAKPTKIEGERERDTHIHRKRQRHSERRRHRGRQRHREKQRHRDTNIERDKDMERGTNIEIDKT